MSYATDEEFVQLMMKLGELFDITPTERQIVFYGKMLSDIPYPDLVVAFGRAARSHEYRTLPTPGQLRAYIEPSHEDLALVAWSSLDEAARTVGAWADIEFEDGATAQAVELVFGSWAEFCALDSEARLAHKRQEFLAAYRVAKLRGSAGPRRLTGLCSAQHGPVPDAVRAHTWVGQVLSDGTVKHARNDQPSLTGQARKELSE